MNKTSTCSFCKGSLRAWYGHESGFIECFACGLVYRYPMPTDSQLDQIYVDFYSNENIQTRKTKMLSSDESIDQHAAYISKNISKPGWRVLDFGAGTGELAWRLQQEGLIAIGVEQSKNARCVAEERYGIQLVPSVDELTKDINEPFDLIVAIEVLEHISEPWRVLEVFNSLLKPGGTLYLSTPNRNGLTARVRKQQWREAVKPFHLVLFNFHSIKRLLAHSGYETVHCLRFSPLTTSSPVKKIVHRLLQLFNLYGGLRVVARKSFGRT